MFILTQACKNMLYLFYMNKEVIYLEPEDDITDILTKLQGAEQKLVALVPPKKATMLRNAVNMKLVARAAKECDKVAVIVTADPAIVKQAMTAQIPVAKTLQSRPVVPTKESLAESEAEEQVIDEDLTDVSKSEKDSLKDKKSGKIAAEGTSGASEAVKAKSSNTIDLSDGDLSDGKREGKNGQKSAKTDKNGKKVPNFEQYRKWIILGAAAVILLVVFGVWAFVFAPAVKITVAMNTSSSSFSENISFTTNQAEANAAEGKFFVEKQSYVDKFEAEFVATGQEDRGDKSKGTVRIAYTLTAAFIKEHLNEGVTISIPANSRLVSNDNGLGYHTIQDIALSWDGTIGSGSTCTSSSSCTLSATVGIEANNSGANYDAGTKTSWSTASLPSLENVSVPSVTTTEPISGGSTKMVTVVTQADVNKAAEARNDSASADGKTTLMAQVPKDSIAIEASYTAEVGELKSSPAVGEEANGQVKLTAETTYSIYTITSAQIDEFVKAKTELGEDQKIYSISDTYVERFTKIEEPARLKATVKTGPTVTEEDVLNRSMGRKTGEVQSLLRSINGVSSVTVTPSYFWVWSVPKNADKVTVELTVEDK